MYPPKKEKCNVFKIKITNGTKSKDGTRFELANKDTSILIFLKLVSEKETSR
jgi:hypothetical protein